MNTIPETSSISSDVPVPAAEPPECADTPIPKQEPTPDPMKDVPPIRQLMADVIEEFHQILSLTASPRGLDTGLRELDELTGGFKSGELIVLASRPGMGKTTLLHSIVSRLVLDKQAAGMIFTGDCSPADLVWRLWLSRAVVPVEMRRAYIEGTNKGDMQRLHRAGVEISRSRLAPESARGLSIGELRAKAFRQRDSEGLDFIAIDHIHLLGSDSAHPGLSRKREFAKTVCGLKSLAIDLNIPVIALASLKPRADRGGIPRMRDLRGAAALESEADVIGVLRHPPEGHDAESPGGFRRLMLDIIKNRSGPTGTQPLAHYHEINRMEKGFVEKDEIQQAWDEHHEDIDDMQAAMEWERMDGMAAVIDPMESR